MASIPVPNQMGFCLVFSILLDTFVVVFGWLDTVLEAFTRGVDGMQIVPLLRILRIARLLRALRLLKLFPELYVMIRGFLGAMKAMFWGFMLIIVLIMIWSLVIVELVHPVARSNPLVGSGDVDDEVMGYCNAAFTGVRSRAFIHHHQLRIVKPTCI